MFRKNPYENLSGIEVITEIAREVNPLRLPVPAMLSTEMKEIYLSCFEFEPKDRPTFVQLEKRMHFISMFK